MCLEYLSDITLSSMQNLSLFKKRILLSFSLSTLAHGRASGRTDIESLEWPYVLETSPNFDTKKMLNFKYDPPFS